MYMLLIALEKEIYWLPRSHLRPFIANLLKQQLAWCLTPYFLRQGPVDATQR